MFERNAHVEEVEETEVDEEFGGFVSREAVDEDGWVVMKDTAEEFSWRC